jgi:hypothetical protein
MLTSRQAKEELKSGREFSRDYRNWLEVIANSKDLKSEKVSFKTFSDRYKECIKGNKELYSQCINEGCGTVYQNDINTFEIYSGEVSAIVYNTKEYNNYKKPICYNGYIDIL